ncbi:hypothetical protein D3C83_165830 [compost metagenome]
MAVAISIIFGVPWSAARVPLTRMNPTAMARSAVTTEKPRTANSPPFNSKTW